MIKKRNKKKNTKNVEDVPEEVSCTKTPSVESSVKLPKLLPLAIGNRTVITQEIATTVVLNRKKNSNRILQNKNYMLKRGPYMGLEVQYVINDVYINEHDGGYFFDITNSNDIRKIKSEKEIRVTFDTWNLYRPSTYSYFDISSLFATCDYQKIIYNCSLLVNISVSVTLPSELMTGSLLRY